MTGNGQRPGCRGAGCRGAGCRVLASVVIAGLLFGVRSDAQVLTQRGFAEVRGDWFPQDAPADAPLARYLTSIDRIEAAIGFDLFPDLPAAPSAVLEAKVAERVW